MKARASVDACVADPPSARMGIISRMRRASQKRPVRYANGSVTVLLCGAALLAACGARESVSGAVLQEQAMATERAFAATMAARDQPAFATFLDPEAVFCSGQGVLRGREQVLDSGTLA